MSKIKTALSTITKKKIVCVCARKSIGAVRSVFAKPDMVHNLEYFQSLPVTIFGNHKQQSVPVLIVYNLKGTKNVKIKIGNKSYTVNELTLMPGLDNYKEWNYANNIINKDLPGTKIKFGTLGGTDIKKPTKSEIPLIHNIGPGDDDNFHTIIPCNISQKDKAIGLGKHKIVMNSLVNRNEILGPAKYAGPEYGITKAVLCITVDSKKAAKEYIKYIQSKKVIKLMYGIKSDNRRNTKEMFNYLPRIRYKDKWK